MKKTIIKVPHGIIKEIAAIKEVSALTVRKALSGDKSVRKYNEIRICALEKGGVELSPINIKNR